MLGIPPNLYKHLKATLLRCGAFQSDRVLRSLFIDERLISWRDVVPENTPNREARVTALIDLLADQQNARNESALAIFLRVLSDQTDPDDACHQALVQLVDDFRAIRATPESRESYYLTGARLQELREELSLKPSEFTELIGLNSERAYLDLEAGKAESSLSLLEKIQEITGAQLHWLKHGNMPKYRVEYLPWPNIGDALSILADLSPERIYASYTSGSIMDVGFCVQVSPFRYRIYQTGVRLAFWNWDDQLVYIPRFYRFLYQLHNTFNPIIIAGEKLVPRQHKQLYENGTVHPASVVQRGFSVVNDWSRDILDIYHKRYSALRYAYRHGPRFVRVQKALRVYADHIADLDIGGLW